MSVIGMQAAIQTTSVCSAEAGITLIVVPHWWDFMEDSLAATISALRSVFPLVNVVRNNVDDLLQTGFGNCTEKS
jgi:hypothetical protein